MMRRVAGLQRGAPWASALVLTALLLLVPLPGAGQDLERVDSLARDGRMEVARSVLMAWFAAEADDADRSEVQRGLWLRGILTLDPRQAEVDFTRLALEYPGGLFSDQALVRLARAARARGELAVAARHYRRLARDYPQSPGRLEARSWLDANAAAIAEDEARVQRERAAAAVEAQPSAAASRPAASPPETTQPTPQRAAPDTARTESARNLDNPAPQGGPFTVQVGAFGDAEGARQLVLRLAEAGVAGRLVTVGESELIRVRAGRFDDAGDATRLYDRIKAAGFDAMVVADAQREVPYR